MAGFPRSERILRRADFQHVYERGTRVSGPFFTLFLMTGAGAGETRPPTRLGIAATKKLGGSVVRNRAKRLIREVFRRGKIAPGFDVVIVPKRELLNASLTALETEYRASIDRALRRAPQGRQRAVAPAPAGARGQGRPRPA